MTFAAETSMWGATAGVWYTEIDDYIGRVLLDEGDPGEAGDELYLRENTGEAEIWGVEGSLRVQLVTDESPYSLVTRAAMPVCRRMSERPITETSAVSFKSAIHRLPSPGSAMRTSCGTMIRPIVRPWCRPSA